MLKIFVEGSDKIFIDVYMELKLAKIKGTDFEVINIGGWTKLKDSANKIIEFFDEGHQLCIVFDADHPDEGGFSKRTSDISDLLSSIDKLTPIKSAIDIFLFPTNQHDGDFETLLENIVNDKRKIIFDCFGKYSDCITSKCEEQNIDFSSPLKKSKIYAYVESLPDCKKMLKNAQKMDFCFGNAEYWNLDSTYLTPLKSFFEKYF